MMYFSPHGVEGGEREPIEVLAALTPPYRGGGLQGVGTVVYLVASLFHALFVYVGILRILFQRSVDKNLD